MLGIMENELDAIIRDSRNHAAWKNLQHQLRDLTGSAGLVGYDELSARARQLERRLKDLLKTDTI